MAVTAAGNALSTRMRIVFIGCIARVCGRVVAGIGSGSVF